jgi:hypothetical protein
MGASFSKAAGKDISGAQPYSKEFAAAQNLYKQGRLSEAEATINAALQGNALDELFHPDPNKPLSLIKLEMLHERVVYEQMPYVPLTVSFAQKYEKLHLKQCVFSQPDMSTWVHKFLNGSKFIPRKQITRETDEFYQLFTQAKEADSKDWAKGLYNKLLTDYPQFIYEAMNLFLMGKISEDEFFCFSELYAYLIDYSILQIDPHTHVIRDIKAIGGCNIYSVSSIESLSLTRNGKPESDYFYPNELMINGDLQILKSGQALKDSIKTTDCTRVYFFKTARFIGAPLCSAKELEKCILKHAERPIDLPYAHFPTKEVIKHRGMSVHANLPLKGLTACLMHHDVDHVLIMDNCQTQIPLISMSLLELYNELLRYLKVHTGYDLSAYQFYLVDFFFLTVYEDLKLNLWRLLRYQDQGFVQSCYQDEIILVICYFIELANRLGMLEHVGKTFDFCQLFQICLRHKDGRGKVENLGLDIRFEFNIGLKQLVEKLSRCGDDGITKILLFKRYIDKVNLPSRNIIIDCITAEQIGRNAYIIRTHCSDDERKRLLQEWREFVDSGVESDNIVPVWIKLNKQHFSDLPAYEKFMTAQKGDENGCWTKNMVAFVLMTKKSHQKYQANGLNSEQLQVHNLFSLPAFLKFQKS